MPSDGPSIPLARWADRQLRILAEVTGSPNIATLDGATLVGERGSNGSFRINGRISAGIGGSRLNQTRDGGWFALTLLRPEDRELLPALFLGAELDIDDDSFPIYASPTASATKAFSWGLGLNWHLNKNVKVNLNYDQTDFKGGAATDLLAKGEKAVFTRAQISF